MLAILPIHERGERRLDGLREQTPPLAEKASGRRGWECRGRIGINSEASAKDFEPQHVERVAHNYRRVQVSRVKQFDRPSK